MAGKSSKQTADDFSVGTRVKLHSLQAAAQHNGADGHLLNWDDSKGRWDVKLSSGRELSVRPANLMPMCSRAGCARQIGIGMTEVAGEFVCYRYECVLGFRKCLKCKRATFCSKDCQLAAWKDAHKKEHQALFENSPNGRTAAQQNALAAILGEERQKKVYDTMNNLYAANNFHKLVQMTREGLAVAEEVHVIRTPVAAHIFCHLGFSLSCLKQHVKGLRLLEQARALAVAAVDQGEGLGAQWVLGRVCSDLGTVHLLQNEYEKAAEVLEQARVISVEQGERKGELVTLGRLAMCYRSLKQYDTAIEVCEQSLAVANELGDRLEQTKTRANLGYCLSQQGQHERAVACLKQACADFPESRPTPETGKTGELAAAATLLGSALWAQALAELHKNHPDATISAQPAGAATSCSEISSACANIMHDAEKWLRRALEAPVNGEQLSDVRLMEARMHLACVAFVKGDKEEAVELLSQHLQEYMRDRRQHCAGCGQRRGQDAPMLSCEECRVVRSFLRCRARPVMWSAMLVTMLAVR